MEGNPRSPGGDGPAPPGRSDLRDAFRNAEDDATASKRAETARKTRRAVRIGRIARVLLVVVALSLIAFIVVWPQVQPRMDRLRIGMASLDTLEGEGEGLVNARLTGSDAKGRPYAITADFVRQLEDTAGVLGLDRPRGEILMEDGTKTVITAADGAFYQDSRLLELDGGVVLVTGDGSRYETASANLDLDAGVASGTEPVRGQGPLGTITGEGFRVTDFGETIFVTGRSTLIVDDSAKAAPS